MRGWLFKGLSLLISLSCMGDARKAQPTHQLVVDANRGHVQISRHLYGHFIEHLLLNTWVRAFMEGFGSEMLRDVGIWPRYHRGAAAHPYPNPALAWRLLC